MGKLILGIGGMSKKVLKLLEGQVGEYEIAVLDCWFRVQEIEITEEEAKGGRNYSSRLSFKKDLSFFIIPPKVDLRFDGSMFEKSTSQRVLGDNRKYQELLEEQYKIEFHGIISTLQSYKEIIVISSSSGWIATIWLKGLLNELLRVGTRVRLLLTSPLDLEGRLKKKISSQLMDALKKMNIETKIFDLQHFASDRGKHCMEDFFREVDWIMKEAVSSLLREEALERSWQDIDLIT